MPRTPARSCRSCSAARLRGCCARCVPPPRPTSSTSPNRTAATASTPAAARSRPSAAARSATSQSPRRKRKRLRRRLRLPARLGRCRRPRPRHQHRPGQRAAYPQRRLARPRPNRRHPAAPQPPGALPGPRPPAAGRDEVHRQRRPGILRNVDPRTLRADPDRVPVGACATGGLPRVHLHLVRAGHRRLRRSRPRLHRIRATSCWSKTSRVLDPHSGLLCAFNEGTTTVTVSHRWPHLLAESDDPRRHRAASLRHDAAAQPGPGLAGPTPAAPPRPATRRPAPNPPSSLPPPPPPGVPAPAPAPVAHQPSPPPPVLPPVFFSAPAQLTTPLVPIVPPPPPLVLQPTPPSGSSYVQENEEEEEEAVEHSSALRRGAAVEASPAGPDAGIAAQVMTEASPSTRCRCWS